jgi:hypothetical protein
MSNRMTGVVAAALGVLVAVGLVLLIMTLAGGDDDATAVTTTTTFPASTTAAPTTSAADTTSTAAITTTAALTTTTAAATTITEVPFSGDVAAKNCPATGSPSAERVTDIRVGEHAGYTRIVFDFSGDVPACYVAQLDPNTISVLIWGVSTTTPYDGGIFGADGILEVDQGSVDRVRDGGMGGGSGEWTFTIHTTTGNRPFSIFTLDDPARLAVDVGD